MVVAVVSTYDPPVCLRLGLHGRAYAEKPAGSPAGFVFAAHLHLASKLGMPAAQKNYFLPKPPSLQL